MEFEFKNYQEYIQHVHEMWDEGYLNELEEAELIIVESEIKDGDKLQTVKFRPLTKNEYKEKYEK